MSNNTYTGGNNTACFRSQISTGLAIPAFLNYYVTSVPLSDPAMHACCEPNAVNLIDNCYVWCRLPELFVKDVKPSNVTEEDERKVRDAFRNCLESRVEWRGTAGSSYIHLATAEEIKGPVSSAPGSGSLGKAAMLVGLLYLVLW